MSDYLTTATDLGRLGARIAQIWTHKILEAQGTFLSRAAPTAYQAAATLAATLPQEAVQAWADYAADCTQRWLLFWDTLRQRGNNYLEHERAGNPPLLHFDHETILDARQFARPVNYALLRIIPPPGSPVDPTRRPFIIIDPRAGHGPGIGGFKQDSQVGVALKAGHPVYFVVFHTRPEPGQTLPDVCTAEGRFVEEVVNRHPHSPRPAIFGNCQAGWATAMLAASRPDVTGPIVINGSPMSYWSGNWDGGKGENPMRYAGGLLGGSWASLLSSDLGGGLFDGAHLVANFEYLNPANTLWTKYYNLFANIDAEPPRFLEFERWWGGYFLMNESEIRWIVSNLFIGNRLARGEVKTARGAFIDLKAIRSPMVVFSSGGDNITPPQQALNWIADVYGSTEEIKANGQVIVGLLNPDVGHLGVFVSGRVAKKEYAGIVEVLEHIEALRPGLYLMEIRDAEGQKGRYEVTIEERRLEDLSRLNQFERQDERPFEAVAALSDINERTYCLFVRPCVRLLTTPALAEATRAFHPLRVQHWAVSDLNPWLAWLPPLAASARKDRQPTAPDNPFRQIEKAASDALTAALDHFRDCRDAAVGATFYTIYGGLIAAGADVGETPVAAPVDPRELPAIKQVLAALGTGGYPEAVALVAALGGRGAGPLPVDRLELAWQFIQADPALARLPDVEIRRLQTEAAIIAELEPERGLQSLPELLANPADRRKALALLDRVVQVIELKPQQQDTLARVRAVLAAGPPALDGKGANGARPELAAQA